jgi:hypothetical protein
MSFTKIDDNNYIIDEDGEKLRVIVQKYLYHAALFSLTRETETKEKVNLFRVLNIFRDIVKSYKKQRPEVDEIFFQFLPNEKIDTSRWIDICEFYLKRQPIKVTRLSNLLILKFTE